VLGVALLRLRSSLLSRLVWLATRPSPPRSTDLARQLGRVPERQV